MAELRLSEPIDGRLELEAPLARRVAVLEEVLRINGMGGEIDRLQKEANKQMANGNRREGARPRINTTNAGPTRPDVQPQLTDDSVMTSGGAPVVIGPAVQPAVIVRGDRNRRGDQGDGSR